MAQLVGEALHVIRLQTIGIIHNVVVCWCNASIPNRLAHYIEVVPTEIFFFFGNFPTTKWMSHINKYNLPLWAGDLCVNDSAWRRVSHLATNLGEKAAADSLLYHHYTQLGPSINKQKESLSKHVYFNSCNSSCSRLMQALHLPSTEEARTQTIQLIGLPYYNSSSSYNSKVKGRGDNVK